MKQRLVPVTETRCFKDPQGKCAHMVWHREPVVLRCTAHGEQFYLNNPKYEVHPEFGMLCKHYKPQPL